jgi:exodeoxyribonuclease V gamma subunit
MVFIKGQQQPLLLNGDLAEKAFTKKRGQLTEMTQARFESLWLGDMSSRGLGDDDYLSYFWPQCPQYALYEDELNVIYQDLYQVVVKKAAAKAKKTPVKAAGEKK